MKIATTLLLVAFIIVGNRIYSQQREPQADPEKENLLKLSEFFHQRHQKRQTEVEKFVSETGYNLKDISDDRYSQIIYIDEFGMPQLYITYNLNAARTTGTNQLWPGGSTGLNLSGNGYIIGIWDGGGVRTTHQEFGSRVTIMDGASLIDHATHVGGTIAASGVKSAAHGMAGSATLRSYDWNDDYSEMTSQAASGLTLSNHSYGQVRGWAHGDWSGTSAWHWLGNTSISASEDYLFGFYDGTARDFDIVAFNAPNYLMVWSAGNDRNDTWSGGHYVRSSSGTWIWSNATRNPDGGTYGYDCIPQQGVAKNILTVGAVQDIIDGWTSPSDVIMSDFSSWGPTDDGRIKPDIVANGVDLYSAIGSGNTSYDYMSGTSMSAPNTTGTLALLQEHYRNGRGETMSASALKGLVINTANEAGPNEGPDYMFGWGLLNAVGAANLITKDNSDGGLIVQGLLVNGQTQDYKYYSNGSPISVTLCWTDPAGTPPAASLNPTTLMLVNNLNLRVIGTTTHFPWRLNPASPAAAATRGDNFRDNVEKVTINDPTPGFYTIRISHGGSLSGGQQAYALIINGLSTPPKRSYCSARSTYFNSFEQIKRVQYGSIDNRSQRSPGGYSNYTGLMTTVNKGSSQTITVTIDGGATLTWGRVYIDWNQDGDFNDPGETFVLGSGVGPTYSTTISVPSTAYGGYTTMRVRVGFGGTPSACGTVNYGETEDYTIKVNGTAGLWTGIYDTDWFNLYNWDNGNVPTSSTNVVIGTPVSFQPNIPASLFAYNIAECNNLTIQSGGVLSMSGGFPLIISVLDIYGNLNSDAGKLIMNGSYSHINFRGFTNTTCNDNNENDVYTNVQILKSKTSAYLTMQRNMTCSGRFTISSGVFAMAPNQVLTVQSTAADGFKVDDGGTLKLQANNTIDVTGGIRFMDGSKGDITGGTLKVRGNFRVDYNYIYNIFLTGATLIFQGSANQYIEDADGGTLQLHHVTIDKTGGTVYINGAALNINGNLLINNGTLSAGNGPSPSAYYNINIKANWKNNNFPAGFVPGTAKVRFNGLGYQGITSSENFNILEANMGNALRVNNSAHSVTCNQYNWTSGGIEVLAGTFTALVLADNGLYGSYSVNPGGTINLYQDASGWIDLNGQLDFNGGGNINIYGGSMSSYWSYGGNAVINMNGGVLDFKNQGIYIYNSSLYTFTHNITGGTIRTSKALLCDKTDFAPAGGTFEFYGSTDASLNMVSGSNLRNVKMNKSSKEGDENYTGEPVYDQRSGEMISEGGKANTLTLASNFIATGNLIIETGSFNLSSYTCNVAGTTTVFGNLIMNNAANDLTTNYMLWDNGSSANVTAGTFHAVTWNFSQGTTAKLGIGNTAYVTLGLHFPTSNDAEFGNLVAGPLTKNITDGDNTKTFYPFRVMGNMLVKSGTNWSFSNSDSPLIVVGNVTIENGGNITFSGADFEVGGALNLDGKLEVSNNHTATIQGAFLFPSTGWLKLNNGTFTNNYNFATYTYLYGKLTMNNNSLLEFPGTSIMIGNSFINEVSGGTLRFGRTLNAPNANNFKLDHGTVEFISAYPNHSVSVYNGNYLNDVVINKTGVSFLVDKNLVIKNDLEINSGSLNTLSNQVTVSGNVTINNGGHLSMGAGGVLAMAASKSVTVKNGGLIEFNGESGTQSKITRNSSGYYALNIESGGKIGAEHTIFEYMNTNGVNIKPGAIIDPANAFTSCIFRLGQSGGRLLTLDNNQTLVIYNAVFPGSPSTYNVSKNVDTGMIIFVDHSGNFSGAAREQDHFSRVHWTGDLAPSVNLNGVNIEEGQNVCFEALQTITTGGSNIFVVENSASANLVAGQKILMLPGTHAKDGSYLHAWISSVGFCSGLPLSIIASKTEEEVLPTHIKAETLNDERFFKVYPNPTKGIFTLELNSVNESGSVKIEIFNLLGERILNTEQQTNSHYQFDLSGNKAGIYFIRVICGENNKIEKLIKQ